jgi:D-alanine-D-alanine ligase
LLELAGVPYVGAGVIGSVLGLDKAAFKDVMKAHGLPIVKHVVFKRKLWRAAPEKILDQVESQIAYPVFTKPANLGSSVGIAKCHNRDELTIGLNDAARYDRKLVVEEAVLQAREIEVSVLGNDEPIASVPGEVIPSREFYSYESKYLDEGEQASKLLIPAPLADKMTERIRKMALQAYLAIDCAGMARIDFLLSGETDALYINEVNTIPGFTKISMYPKLWEATGISYPELIDRLIALAIERFEDKNQSETRYNAQGS